MKARSTVLQSSRWGVNLREVVGGGWWEECEHWRGEGEEEMAVNNCSQKNTGH